MLQLLTEGTILGRYRIERCIGSGGTAEVYTAHVEGSDAFTRKVAIKRVRPELLSDARVREALRAEARLAQRLHHGNIVQLLDVVDDGLSPCLVMEYVDGLPLRALLADLQQRRDRLPVGDALAIVEQVGTALGYAHRMRDEQGMSLRVVHRDVTPSNILVSREGVVKLADFGIARATVNPWRTQPGTIKGTLGYMAPEQVQGLPADARTDQFSLGVVLHELLTGSNPLLPGSASDSQRRQLGLARVLEGLPPLPLGAPVDEALAAVVARATAVAPAGRFASVDELVAALEQWRAARRIRGTAASLAAAVLRARGETPAVPRKLELPGLPGAPLDQPATEEASLAAPRRHRRPVALGAAGGALGAALLAAGWAGLLPARGNAPAPRRQLAAPPIAAHQVAAGAPPTAAARPPDQAPPAATSPAPATRAAALPQPGPDGGRAAPDRATAIDPRSPPVSPTPARRAGQRGGTQAHPGDQARAATATPRTGRGRLKINLLPYAVVSIDGQPRGATPVDVSLAAGEHMVELANPDTGVRRSVRIVVTSGKISAITAWPQ
jgi:tRNA A-37 threonylcarbamoyl transferase component Bud32